MIALKPAISSEKLILGLLSLDFIGAPLYLFTACPKTCRVILRERRH
ncbi:putative lipoprotein [Leptospira santarosai str. CBC523]|nr:putative lipoprotein [Leptospira santarosai str. CBC523]